MGVTHRMGSVAVTNATDSRLFTLNPRASGKGNRMSLIDELNEDPLHYMHGTTKGWLSGCRCWKCAEVSLAIEPRPKVKPKPIFTVNSNRPWTDEEDELLIELWNQGMTTVQITKKMGTRTKNAVRQRVVFLRRIHLIGDRKVRKPWTKKDDYRLIRMKKAGKSGKEIAERLGRTVNAVRTRTTQLRKEGKLP